MELTAKTEVGNVTSKIHLNPKKATKNNLELQLNSEKRNLEVEFPDEVETQQMWRLWSTAKKSEPARPLK